MSAFEKAKVETIEKLEKEVGRQWLEKISEKELAYFVVWAAETAVYLYPGNNEKLGDAFRGYVTGLQYHRKEKADWKPWELQE